MQSFEDEHMKTRNELQAILDKNDVSRFVDASTICNWLIQDDDKSPRFVHAVKVLSGLFNNEFFDGTEKAEELMDVLMRLSHQMNDYNLKDPEPDQTFILSNITLPPLDWTKPYGETFGLLNEMKFFEACRKFDETFISLLEESTTEREPYRLFFNASNAYLYGGLPDLGMACLNYSLKLNPNYPPSRARIKALRSGEMDLMINMGSRFLSGGVIDGIGSVDPIYLPPFYLMTGLRSVGVEISRKDFDDWSNKYNSVKEIMDSELNIKDEDREFVNRSISALWKIYRPDVPHHELLEKVLWDLDEEIDEPEENNDNIDCYLNELEGLIFNDKEDFLKDYPGFNDGGSYELEAMISVLMYLDRQKESREKGLRIAEKLKQETGSAIWSVVIDFLKEDDIEEVERMAEEYREDDSETVLLWDIAERFLDNRTYMSEPESTYMYEEEEDLSIIEGSMDEEELLDELIQNEMFEKLTKIADDDSWKYEEDPEVLFHPTSVYFRHLKGLGLNFETERDVESITAPFINSKKKNKKTGRNDPCPCGSGKKYKKCCLR